MYKKKVACRTKRKEMNRQNRGKTREGIWRKRRAG